MRAKMLNENDGGYPLGAEYDRNAPWNEEPDNAEVTVKADDSGIDIITTVQIAEDDWDEVDRETIDYSDMNEFLAKKFNLDFPKIEDEEGINVTDITDIKNGKYEITVSIKVPVSLVELYDLAEKTRKRNSKYHKHPEK